MAEAPYDNEGKLQELLAKFSGLLAADQLPADEPRRWLLIDRESALPDEERAAGRWSVDPQKSQPSRVRPTPHQRSFAQSGYSSLRGSDVTRCRWEPSASITQICSFPGGVALPNAMRLPFGESAGSTSFTPSFCVR
jgi:hypothetical protein